jgi:hypothetical protein
MDQMNSPSASLLNITSVNKMHSEMTANLNINESKTWTIHSSEKYVGQIAKTHVLATTLPKKNKDR